jgi:hypothetical protein
MDKEKEILAVHSKEQVAKFVKWIGKDKMRFQHVMECFLEGDEQLARKSAWIIGHSAEVYPELVSPWLKPMLKIMQKPGVHGAMKRNVVRILQFADIPSNLQGSVANLCFKLISSPDEPIAVRTFSITVLAKIAQDESALRKELEILVQHMLPSATAAFRARAKKMLKYQEINNLHSFPDEF